MNGTVGSGGRRVALWSDNIAFEKLLAGGEKVPLTVRKNNLIRSDTGILDVSAAAG